MSFMPSARKGRLFLLSSENNVFMTSNSNGSLNSFEKNNGTTDTERSPITIRKRVLKE